MTWLDLFPPGKMASIWRDNWNAFKASCSDAASEWEEPECLSCIHCDEGWCLLANFPTGFNPYLSFRTGHPGLACMGAGFEPLSSAEVSR